MTAPSTDGRAAPPRVRKDVARNRALLLEAADALMATRGLDMTLHELAEAAGLGVGTVYRHFADKDVLLDALVDRRFAATRKLMLAAEQVQDPIQALRRAVLDVCEFLTTDRATLQAMLSDTERHQKLAEHELKPIVMRIVDRALATGRLRADFSATDLSMIFLCSGGVAAGAAAIRPDLWRRYVDGLLDGFMTRDADRAGLTVGPPAESDLPQIMAGWG